MFRSGPDEIGRSWAIVARLTFAFLLASALAPASVYGYIDPLSGSAILQALAAGVLAGLFMLRSYWQRVKDVFRRFWHRDAE
ncbi:MAG TPA: hypothetical protein VM737_04850 [Gemmatimonadota bacterium]|nr:hypothetical protein [Gemmatimonadota bacterium]